MKILLLGGGGREHALGWKLSETATVVSAPGNPGLAACGPVLGDVDPTNPDQVVDAAVATDTDLVVVGPEAPLAAGVADALAAKSIPCFGPAAAAARLESSKSFAKEMMRRAGVPTAAAVTFTDADAARTHLQRTDGPYVVKADGLAAGKGVLVTADAAEAIAWAEACFIGRFGAAGASVVIEECLRGDEVSVFAICDGTTAVPLQPARDYKRLSDDDTGPNTGGMGSYSPVLDLPADLVATTVSTIMDPVLAELRRDGIEYRGFLYAGLMLTEEGPKVIEFNCRLGDPETQVLMPRLDGDLGALLAAAAEGSMGDTHLTWHDTAAVDVVLAAGGYPESPRRGDTITGLDAAELIDGALVFHAGTRLAGEQLVTAGGRVINVVGTGSDVAAARVTAYAAADLIDFEGKQFRSDIAARRTGWQ